jgi:uncharacterized protein YndB with AHSA1/START domain
MNKNLFVSKSIHIGSPRETVWRVLTQPKYVKQYLYGADLLTDWHVGSPVVFRGEFEGQVWQDQGTVLTWEPPTLLVYSYYSGTCGLADLPENYATVTYKLGEEAGGTVLAVRQQGYPGEESQNSSSTGWDGVLTQIKALAETEK